MPPVARKKLGCLKVHMCLCSYIADTSPEVEEAAVKRGLPLGADSCGNLYFHLGSESGNIPSHPMSMIRS